MCDKLSPPRRVDRFERNFGGIYNSTRAIAWGSFPLPVGTSDRKYGCFRKPEVGTGNWKYSRWKENKILGQKYYSTFLIFWLGEASEASKKIFFPCKSIWASHIKWTPTKNVRIHTGEKRYSCDFCDKRFTDPSSRAKHMLTHPESGAVKCKKCSVFLMSMELEDHMINCKRNYPK